MIEKKEDKWAQKSSVYLKDRIRQSITAVFKNSLKCIEIRFGDEFDGYDAIRKNILDEGNSVIRKMNEIVDAEFNIEHIPNQHIFKVKGD